MKKILRNLTIYILSFLIVIGTYSLISGVQVWAATNNESAPTSVMSNNSGLRADHGPQVPALQKLNSSVSLLAGASSSSNWAGYVDTPVSGNGYTSVSGSWMVPDISSSSGDSEAAQWVGLGGVSTSDLLQIGTVEYISNGQAYYEVFYEKLPDFAQYLITVGAGSKITASVYKSSDSSDAWDLTYSVVAPNGETQTDTVSVTLDSSYAKEIGTSAEWISEDPANGNGQLYPLADMGTVAYSSATVNGEALNSAENTPQPITLKSGNEVLISPSSIGSDGMSFSTNMGDGTGSGNWGSGSSGSSNPLPANSNGQHPGNGQVPSSGVGQSGQTGWNPFSIGIPGFSIS